MTASFRSLAIGFGLGVALVAGTTAIAAPLPKAPIGPYKPVSPKINPTPILTQGLTSKATLSPRDLFDNGVSLNVHRGVRVEATSNRVQMDKHTQLWVHFKAQKDVEYDVDCTFSGSKSILTMDYASGKFVRSQSASPSADGRLHHKVYARSKTENVKLYMQASGNLDWMACTVEPA